MLQKSNGNNVDEEKENEAMLNHLDIEENWLIIR
jgi:hypothetical protein